MLFPENNSANLSLEPEKKVPAHTCVSVDLMCEYWFSTSLSVYGKFKGCMCAFRKCSNMCLLNISGSKQKSGAIYVRRL